MTLWFARRHPDTPLSAKLIGAVAVAYALSPIDLIPDFIPVLGYLDDLLLLPVLVWAAIYLVPAHVLEESRTHADAFLDTREQRPGSRWGTAVIVALWAIALAGFVRQVAVYWPCSLSGDHSVPHSTYAHPSWSALLALLFFAATSWLA